MLNTTSKSTSSSAKKHTTRRSRLKQGHTAWRKSQADDDDFIENDHDNDEATGDVVQGRSGRRTQRLWNPGLGSGLGPVSVEEQQLRVRVKVDVNV